MKKKIFAFLAMSALSAAAMADDGSWMIRVRALDVIPQTSGETALGDVKASDSFVPELDITRFFTENVAAELILATTKHNLSTSGGTGLGSVWLLPPTLTLQYHFTDLTQYAKPYVGAGINYTVFYDSSVPAGLKNVSYSNSVGAALQAGVDIPLKNNWYFNLDAKKLFISTTAKFDDSAVRANVDLNPVILGAGVGYRF